LAKNRNKTNVRNDKDINALDQVAKKMLSLVDSSYNERSLLDNRSARFRAIMDRELELSKGVSGGSIVDFVSSLIPQNNGNKTVEKLDVNNDALFTKNVSDIFGYFQDLYKNRYIEMTDLKFIAKFIPALGEAVRTTLDAVVSSDTISATINRGIKLPKACSNDDKALIMTEIERMEKELHLLAKLKNVVYKKTLVTGQYYVYAVAYSELFNSYETMREKKTAEPSLFGMTHQKNGLKGKATENNTRLFGDIDLSPAFESMGTIFANDKEVKPDDIKNICSNMESVLPNIYINTDIYLSEAMEGTKVIDTAKLFSKYDKTNKDSDKTINGDNLNVTVDGTKGVDEVKSASAGKHNIPGTYIKYIDSKNIIPVKALDQLVGYYVIHPSTKKNKSGGKNGQSSLGSSLFSSINASERKKEEAIDNIVNTISDGIMSNFSDKFTSENTKFKKLIADCIISNGLVDNDYNIQFIPAEYIYEFKINETEEGYGESILSDSLFPAKTLLSMIVTRMLNYINKTGNKTIAHIYKGPIDAYTTNQINRVVRDLQDSNITFNDLLSPNTVFNKFNRDGNIAIPTTNSGKKLVEFETQEGQNIDMNPEYENKLEQMAILGTGVPAVIMEYEGQADFAKQIVSANIKFAGRVTTIQSDLEDPTTRLYKTLVVNSALSDNLKSICEAGLEFKLPAPKVLVNGNNNDYIRSSIETATSVADIYVSQDSTLPKAKEIKDELTLAIVKETALFFDWDKVDAHFNDIKVRINGKPDEDKAQDSTM